MSLLDLILKNGYQINKEALSILEKINQIDSFLEFLNSEYPTLFVIDLSHINEFKKSIGALKEKRKEKEETLDNLQQTEKIETSISEKFELKDKISAKYDFRKPIDWSFHEIKNYILENQIIDSVEDFTRHYFSRCVLLSNIASKCLKRRRLTEFSFKEGKYPLTGSITISGIITRITKINFGFELILENQYSKIIKIIVKEKKLLKDIQKIPKNVVISVNGEIITETNSKIEDIIKINAKEIHFPDCPINSHLLFNIPKNNKLNDIDPYLLIVGDIHYGNSKMDLNRYDNFLNYLIEGKTTTTGDKHHGIYDRIKGVVFLGDIIDIKAIGYEKNSFDYSKIYSEFFKRFDQIPDSIEIVVIPGEKDFSDYFIPQRPLQNYSTRIKFNTNPSYLQIGYRKILIYHDFSQKILPSFINLKQITELYKLKLRLNHLSPKWKNEKVYQYPTYPDTLIIDDIPDIMVIGHHQVSSYELYNNTLIVTGGTFKYSENLLNKQSLGIIPAINLRTLEVTMLSF